MLGFVIQILASAAALFLVGRMVDGIRVRDARAALFGTLVLGLVNFLLMWVVRGLILPLGILMIPAMLVINAVALMVTGSVIRGMEVRNFRSALVGSVTLALANLVLGLFLGLVCAHRGPGGAPSGVGRRV